MTPSLLGTLEVVLAVAVAGGLLARSAARMAQGPAVCTVLVGSAFLALAALVVGPYLVLVTSP